MSNQRKICRDTCVGNAFRRSRDIGLVEGDNVKPLRRRERGDTGREADRDDARDREGVPGDETFDTVNTLTCG